MRTPTSYLGLRQNARIVMLSSILPFKTSYKKARFLVSKFVELRNESSLRKSYYYLIMLFWGLFFQLSFPTSAYTQSSLLQLEKIETQEAHFGLSLLSFTNFEEVNEHLIQFQKKGIPNLLLFYESNKNNQMVFQLIAGPYRKQEAKQMKRKWKKKKIISKIVDINRLSATKKAKK